ncbi:hypothetical protein GCM10009535_30850 [Streptomyces thermocarboxydovorans]|uniref:Uncharacterized protein n=1 Tax=Streptomyces thermocarboxydovorans TaxID=59298 RepID=A0ABP3SPJ5_9ACTN
MTQSTGAGTGRGSFLDELKDAVTPHATLLVAGVIALQLLFIASYVGALHDPKLRDASFGGHGMTVSLPVLSAWAPAGIAVTLVMAALRTREDDRPRAG